MNGLLLQGARTWGGAPADILVRGGRIASVAPAGTAQPSAGVQAMDARGCVALPGFVDAHAHLDKTLWGTPWHPHQAGPSIAERIAGERRVLRALALAPDVQAARLLRRLVACGTTHVRTHADVDPELGLAHLHALQAVRERHRDAVELQIVAFPQSGVAIRPGTLALLEQAVREGAELVGGIDPIGIDRDPKTQLDGLFAIAQRHGCGIDIHLHERGEMGLLSFSMIAERTASLGLQGKVAISHAFFLGSLEPAQLDDAVRLLLDNDIAVMTHAPAGPTPFPPVRLLHERGVRLFTGSDGVRDAWSPLNNGDMLERAYLLAYRSGFRDDPGIELALRMATHGGAQAMGCGGDYGLHEGAQADLVLVEADTAAEAVCMHPPRRCVIKRGRVVARDGRALLPSPDDDGGDARAAAKE